MTASATQVQIELGRFIWRDLVSVDAAKSEAFFSALFGWTVTPMEHAGGTYRVIETAGTGIGGYVPLESSAGVPSHWISYISTPDADATVAQAVELGATVIEPVMEMPGVGRWAVLADPEGALFTPMQPFPMGDQPPPAHGPGAVAWNELMAADTAKATDFYRQLFGWTAAVDDMGMGPYTTFSCDGKPTAGLGTRPAEMPVAAWTIYFETADIDASLTRVSELGGQMLFPVMDIPGVGKIAWATDPTGATFALMQPDMTNRS